MKFSVPCHIPTIPNGVFKLVSSDQTSNVLTANVNQLLNDTIDISNGEIVMFTCNPGYNVQGSTNLKCWHGEWTVTTLPECTPGENNELFPAVYFFKSCIKSYF